METHSHQSNKLLKQSELCSLASSISLTQFGERTGGGGGGGGGGEWGGEGDLCLTYDEISRGRNVSVCV